MRYVTLRVHRTGRADRLILRAIVVGGALFTAACTEIRVPNPDARYIAFGDSTTAGPVEGGYPDILRTRLGEPPEAFAHEGESGETSEEGKDRLSALLEGAFFPNAEVLLFWQGGGDVVDFIQDHDPFLLSTPGASDYPFAEALVRKLDAVEANIESSIRSGRNAGLDVYVATYFFIREGLSDCPALPFDILLPFQAQRSNIYLELLNERIRRAAADQGAILVDVATLDAELRMSAANYIDCNHLSAAGNEIVADLFLDVIRDREE